MVKRFYRVAVSMALASSLVAGCMAEEPASLVAVTGGLRSMGTSWKIKIFAPNQAVGDAAIASALADIERLDRVLSDYDPKSELSRLSAAAPTREPVSVSDDLWQVLVAAEGFRETSGGAFDISVGPLTKLWRQSRRSRKLPRADKLAAARASVGAGSIELDEATNSVQLMRPGMRLDAGGIGMGYAADQAMKILKAHGIRSAMVDVSGDIVVSAAPPGADGWRILIAPLQPGGDAEVIGLSHAAVTTSGDAYQAVEIDGVRYSHIVDPRTGIGVHGPAAVTVVAPDATTADALATTASVLGPKDGPAVLAKYPRVSARFIWRDGSDVRVAVTPGWPGGDATKPVDAP